MNMKTEHMFAGILRIMLGFTFLWAFFDKLFGLGFSTEPEKSWLNGVSPTYGFLKFASKGIFSGAFNALAGSKIVDWLFMGGLVLIGLSLVLGIAMRMASIWGSLLLFLMYIAVLPPEHNPVLDEHTIYIAALFLLNSIDAGKYFGYGETWSKNPLVIKYPFLR